MPASSRAARCAGSGSGFIRSSAPAATADFMRAVTGHLRSTQAAQTVADARLRASADVPA